MNNMITRSRRSVTLRTATIRDASHLTDNHATECRRTHTRNLSASQFAPCATNKYVNAHENIASHVTFLKCEGRERGSCSAIQEGII